MRKGTIAAIILVFIYGFLLSGLGWVVKTKGKPPVKQKEVLIDSLKIDSVTIIKIYKNR